MAPEAAITSCLQPGFLPEARLSSAVSAGRNLDHDLTVWRFRAAAFLRRPSCGGRVREKALEEAMRGLVRRRANGNTVCEVVASIRRTKRQTKFILNERPERRLSSDQEEIMIATQDDAESALTLNEVTEGGPDFSEEGLGVSTYCDDAEPFDVGPDHKSGYVALIGMPNVGKSTLMNMMIGQKLSIVTSRPQTTRHRILGICSAPGYQMILYDTPGVIRKRMHKLDDMMMKNVRSAAINADCVLVLVDASQIPEKPMDVLDEETRRIINSRPALLVLNKSDLIKPGEIAMKKEWYGEFSGINDVLVVSAKYGHGVDALKNWLVLKLPLGPAYYPMDYISDYPEKFFAAEIVREKILIQYLKEIPYASQVNVVTYVEREPPAKDYIEIEVVVERESQKGILIGKDGLALKTLATASRLDIEDFVGRAVFLEVKVKVKENWRKNEDLLRGYGYSGRVAC